MTVTLDPAAEWWITSVVATYLGLKVATVSAYRARGQIAAALGKLLDATRDGSK